MEKQHVRKCLIICETQLAGGLSLKKLKYFEVIKKFIINNYYYLLLSLLIIPLFFWLHLLQNICQQGVSRVCIIPYKDGSKAPIRLSGRGKPCLAFVCSGMFGLSITPKEKPFSTQFPFDKKTCTQKRGSGGN